MNARAMSPIYWIVPGFLLLNLLLGAFSVATRGRAEVYPFTLFNLYSRIQSTYAYPTLAYELEDGTPGHLTGPRGLLQGDEAIHVERRLRHLSDDRHEAKEAVRSLLREFGVSPARCCLVEVSGPSDGLLADTAPYVRELRCWP